MATGKTIRRREPAIEMTPGDGLDDSTMLTISANQDTVETLDDRCSPVLAPLCMAPLNWCVKQHDTTWSAPDAHKRKMRAGAAMLKVTAAEAARLATIGVYARDQETAAAAAASQVFRVAEKATALEVCGKFAEDVTNNATGFSESFIALCEGFQREYNGWAGFDAVGDGDFSLESANRACALEDEIRAANTPMSTARQQLAVLIDAESPMLPVFVRSARKCAREILSLAPAKFAITYPVAGSADFERGEAQMLLRDLDKYKIESRPPSLDVTANLLGVLRQLAVTLWGVAPHYCVAAEWSITGAAFPKRDIEIAQGRQWSPDPTFLARFCPPNAGPPGWSAPLQSTSRGGIVRMPASRGDSSS